MSNIHSVTPDISVLLSVFNEEKYIVDAITSVLDQTYENFELIIIDDASTDKTLEILKSFKDTRINIFTNNRNIGQTKTLNIGLDKCRGRYIARIDGNSIGWLLNRTRFDESEKIMVDQIRRRSMRFNSHWWVALSEAIEKQNRNYPDRIACWVSAGDDIVLALYGDGNEEPGK